MSGQSRSAESDTMQHLAATLAQRYIIERELGRGGMATVYLARDVKHDRHVAIKVLHAALAAALGAERFLAEIRTTASLQHPHILPLHDSGDAGGFLFYVMPFIDGESLRDRLAREGRLSVADAVRLTAEVADALGYAHHRGVIHRDVKPENILLSAGHALMADFGIAKAVIAADDQRLTQTGVAVGTPAYMSPEQALGGASLDARSDVYSLGCVLFEMLTGAPPFAAETPQRTLMRRLTEAPPALTGLRQDVGARLSEVVQRTLAPDPDDRPATGTALAQLLASLALVSSAATPVRLESRPAIAVLSFENRSNDPEQDYFAEGIAEDLITRLSAWRTYPVIASQASFALKGRALDVKEIGAKLGARYIVQGSVRKAGTRVRIAAHLVDASNAQEVWAQTYDRDLTDIFAVQDEISEAIAAPLVGDLQRTEVARAVRHPPDSLDAWDLLQGARSRLGTGTKEDLAVSRAKLERAISLDEGFAAAHACLAEVGFHEFLSGWTDDPTRTLDEAIAEARRAVELDPMDADAHNSLSLALMLAYDGFGAREAARRAVELNPSLPRALTVHAYHRQIAGYPPEESIEQVHHAMRLSPHDPYEWLYYDVLSGTYFNAGRFIEGLEAGQRLIALSPRYYWGYLWSAMNAVGLGRIEQARAFVQEGHAIQPGLSFEVARTCLGTMAPDVERRFVGALRAAGLE